MDNQSAIVNILDQEAKKRREEVSVKVSRPLPSFIQSIQSTTVSYVVDPNMLPFALIDPIRLVKLMEQHFQLTFRQPSFDPRRLENLGFDVSRMTQDGLLRFLLQGDNPMIAFQNGRYPTGTNSFVLIEGLEFGKEGIAVKIKGITEVAEAIVADAFEIFWQAAGASKRWESEDVKESVALVNYQTVTIVSLGVNTNNLLNNNLNKFLDENTAQGKNIGAAMMPYSKYDKFEPNMRIMSSWTFKRLVLDFHSFDPQTGRTNTAILDIDTRAKDDRGRGIAEITSELPFDKHVDLVKEIISAVKPSK